MANVTLEKLDRLEDRVRMLNDDRAVALVKQLRALNQRGDLDSPTFDKYMRELERNVDTDLKILSAEDRALVGELGHLLRQAFSGMRPSSWKKAARRILIGRVPSEVDDFGRDEEFIQRMRPVSEFLFNKYWRI